MLEAILSISKMLAHTLTMALPAVEFRARFRGDWIDEANGTILAVAMPVRAKIVE
ncbi:MAG: hypothetical protein PUP92_13015 [Rhizonema sp. PD38]|nr:hypothetical protein [Rhizonema sp. PD38]